MSDETRRRLVYFAVALVVFAAFWPSLANAPVWDDVFLTVENPFLASVDGVIELFQHDMWTTSSKREASSFYRPIAMASYALSRAIGGNGAASYHAGNVALHAANAVLLGAFAERVARVRVLAAALAALGFALAPLNTEAVTWLSGRFDLIGTTFLLLSLLANAKQGETRLLSVPLVLFALLSKEAFITGAPLLVACDLALLGRSPRSEWRKWGALAAAVALVFVLRRMVGVMGVAAYAATPPLTLLASFAFLLTTFGRQLVWPSYLDPFRHYAPPSAIGVAIVLLISTIALAAAIASWRRAPGDPRRAAIAFGVLWALMTLAPASVTGPNLEMVGDRYAYVPLVGVFLVAAVALDRALDAGTRAAPIAAAFGTIVLIGAAVRDRVRLAEWRDERTLFSASLRDDPANFYSVYSLGQLEAIEGRFAEAEPLLLRADQLRPRYWRTENALCFVWLNQDRLAAAERACLATVDHNPENPRGWINLTSVYVRAKMWTRCLEVVPEAIAKKPRDGEPYYLRAVCRANSHDFKGATDDVRAALTYEPGHHGARDLLSQLRARGVTP